jgi:hypothetical protein
LPEAPLPRFALLAWRYLPLLLLFDVIFLAALIPAGVAVLAGGAMLAPIVAALCAGPVGLAGAAIMGRIANGEEEVGVRALMSALARSGAGATTALPYGIVGTLTLAALATLANGHSAGVANTVWQAAPLLLDIVAGTLLLIALPAVFNLAARGARGMTLWRGALGIATLRPAVFGELALGTAVVAVVATLSHGPALLFFAPAFVTFHCSVSFRAAEHASRRVPIPESVNQ